MKKAVAILLMLITLMSVFTVSYALTDSQQQMMAHYEQIMAGSWQSIGSGTPIEFTFDPARLLITGDNRVYYNFYDKDLTLVSGNTAYPLSEVLLSNDPSLIVITRTYNDGKTAYIYFQKID